MMFVVAENNEPSVQFYKRRGAEDLSQEEGWRLFRFDKDSLVKMATPAEEWQRSSVAQEGREAAGESGLRVWLLKSDEIETSSAF